jgi:hypothetical protein
MEIPWGPIEAIGSILGGVAAVVAIGAKIRSVRREREERDPDVRAESHRLACLVTVHLDSEPNVDYINDHLPRYVEPDYVEPEYERVRVLVANHGPEPIHSAMVFVPGRYRPLHIGTVNPGQSKGMTWMDAPLMWHVENVGCGCPGTRMDLDLEVVFTDNRGARWRRNGEREPVPIMASDDVEADWEARQRAIEEARRAANEALQQDPVVIAISEATRYVADEGST